MKQHCFHFLFLMAVVAFWSASAIAGEGDWAQVGSSGAWKATIAGAILKDQLYTAEDNGGLYRTNLATGEWAQIGKSEFANTVRMYAAGDNLYTIESDGSLYRVSPVDGSWAQVGAGGAWKATIAGTTFKGQLYTAEDNGGLYRTDLATGEWAQIGKSDFANTARMFAAGDKLYTIETDGSLYCVNPNDGSWNGVGARGAWNATSAGVTLHGWLYTTENNGGLYRTDLVTGEWQQLGKSDFANTRLMFAMGPDLYTIETDGSLYRVSVATPPSLDVAVANAGITAGTPGVGVRVIQGGKVVVDKCYGLANVKDKRPITPQTTFELASCSKQFTGTAILKLYEQGKLSLDDDIRKYLPELPVYDRNNPIRIRHLEQHTSGLPDYLSFPNVQGKDPKFLSNADYVGEFARQQQQFPLRFPTGEKFEYQNTNYMLLALIVERVSKKSYGTFLKSEIFDPLQMTSATVYENPNVSPKEPAVGYQNQNGAYQETWGCPPYLNETLLTVGDGGVWVSLEDLTQWDRGWREGRILKPATIKMALVPSKTRDGNTNGYAFGWGVNVDKGNLLDMGHNGAWGGFLTIIDRNLAVDRTVLILSNDGQDPGPIRAAAR